MKLIQTKIRKKFEPLFKERLKFKEPFINTTKDGMINNKLIIGIFYPLDESEIIEIVKFCNKRKIPFSVRGNSKGESHTFKMRNPTVLIIMEKMNKVKLNKLNSNVFVQAGVINETLFNYLDQKGFFFPLDDNDLRPLSVGGCVALNSFYSSFGSYLSADRFILDIHVILPNGDKIIVGSGLGKSTFDYLDKNIFIGSSGVFGIITAVTFKLLKPSPLKEVSCFVFDEFNSAFNFSQALNNSPIKISSLKYFDHRLIEFSEEKGFENPGKENIFLYCFFQSKNNKVAMDKMKDLYKNSIVLEKEENSLNISSMIEKKKKILGTIESHSFQKRIENVIIAPEYLSNFLDDLKKIEKNYAIEILTSGEILEGFLTLYILNQGDESGFTWNKFQYEVLEKITAILFSYGGTVAGSDNSRVHQKALLSGLKHPYYDKIHTGIKKILDPLFLMNKEKFW